MRLTAKELLILFALGAAGGLVGDAGHVQSGTTTYLDDATPFIWESALWFPILVGLATASLGDLRLRLGPPRPGFDARTGIAAIAAVLAIYAVTALVHDEPEGPATTLIVMLAVLVACWLGGGRPAIICGLAAAIVGPAGRDPDRRARPGRVRPHRRLPVRRRALAPGALLRLRRRRRPAGGAAGRQALRRVTVVLISRW